MQDYRKQMKEANEHFVRLLETVLNDINQIDMETPWQETEPNMKGDN